MAFTLDFSGLGEGLSDLAAGIAAKKKKKEVEGFIGSVNLLDQIASDQEITPDEAAQYTQTAVGLGLQVPDNITDVGALRQSILNKFPVLSFTNREVVDQSIMNLQKQQAAITGLQSLLPELYKFNPEAAEGIRAMAQVDPLQAMDMTKDLFMGHAKSMVQAFGTGQGQAQAFVAGGGKEVYDYKQESTLQSNKELRLFQHELNKDLANYRKSLGGAGGGGSKITPLSQVNLFMKFNDILKGGTDKLSKLKADVNARLDKNVSDLTTNYAADMEVLQRPALNDITGRPITNFDVIVTGLKAAKSKEGVDAAQAATDALINSGRITGTKEELEAIKASFESNLAPTEPGTTATISGPGKQLLENIATDLNNQEQIKSKESQFAGYSKMSQDELINFARTVQDPQALEAINSYLSATGAVESIGEIQTPSGMGSDLGIPEISARIQQMTPETTWEKAKQGIGGMIDKIMPPKPSDENIKVKQSEVKVDESGKITEEGPSTEFVPAKQGYTQSQVDDFKATIQSSKSALSPSATVSNFQEFLNDDPQADKLSQKQVQDLVETIKKHNESLKRGGPQ